MSYQHPDFSYMHDLLMTSAEYSVIMNIHEDIILTSSVIRVNVERNIDIDGLLREFVNVIENRLFKGNLKCAWKLL